MVMKTTFRVLYSSDLFTKYTHDMFLSTVCVLVSVRFESHFVHVSSVLVLSNKLYYLIFDDLIK